MPLAVSSRRQTKEETSFVERDAINFETEGRMQRDTGGVTNVVQNQIQVSNRNHGFWTDSKLEHTDSFLVLR